LAQIATLFWFLLYCLIFVPLSIVYRLFAKDKLGLAPKSASDTYWVKVPLKKFGSMTSQY
jgi:hypothetical protein